MTVRRLFLAAAGALLLLPAAAHARTPKEKPCPRAGQTIAAERARSGAFDARIYRVRGVAYGCSTFYPSYGRVTRLGRFKPRLAAVNGTEAIWTVRKNGVDRVSAAELYSGERRVANRIAVPKVSGGAARRAARIDAVTVDANGVFAWIASTGDLVVGGQSIDEPPVVSSVGGDVHTAFLDGNVAVVDGLEGLSAATRRGVVRSLRFRFGQGESDECGGAFPTTWRWTAPLGTARANTLVSWTNPSC